MLLSFLLRSQPAVRTSGPREFEHISAFRSKSSHLSRGSLACFDESIYRALHGVVWRPRGASLEGSLQDLRGIVFPSCDPASAPLKPKEPHTARPHVQTSGGRVTSGLVQCFLNGHLTAPVPGSTKKCRDSCSSFSQVSLSSYYVPTLCQAPGGRQGKRKAFAYS